MSDSFPAIPCPVTVTGFAWVYILQSGDGSLYIGQTRDLRERLRKHRLGLGSKHTHDHGTPRLVFCEGPMALGDAVKREAQLKRWSRAKKDALIREEYSALKQLSQSRN
jgi:putative endonuclease